MLIERIGAGHLRYRVDRKTGVGEVGRLQRRVSHSQECSSTSGARVSRRKRFWKNWSPFRCSPSGYAPPMAAVRLYRCRDAEHPARRGAYMLDPVAFRQSVARVVGTRMKDATQWAACGNNPRKPVLRSMRNGAGVGAVQGGATDFVGGEIRGGVTGGATGIPGAALGGFVVGRERRFHSLELLQMAGQPRSPASPCTHFGNKCIM
jgi:hypothetical protein